MLDRTSLIDLVARKTNLPAVARACLTGKVEVLGGFDSLDGIDSGWVLRITAKHGTEYLVAVVPEDTLHDYQVMGLTEVPWHTWVGTRISRERYSVYAGDHPAIYDARRDIAIEHRANRRGILI